jgi:ABC-type anion transport system duplicated permease subunit
MAGEIISERRAEGRVSGERAVPHRRRRHCLVATQPEYLVEPLMVLGTQWYILFNVIAGASAFPTDLREASTLYRLRTWQWWREAILPGIFPYYVTGALTASGGS